MSKPILTVAWISDFPIEWLPDLPEALRSLPKAHPLTWQRVLVSEFENRSDLNLHILVLRKKIREDVFFQRNGVSFHILKTRGGMRAPSLFWLDTLRIRAVLRRIQPDLVHAWGTERGAALVASRLQYPHLVTIQGLHIWYHQLVPLNAYERFMTIVERHTLPRLRVVTTESSFAVRYLRGMFPDLSICQVEHAPNWLFHRVQRAPETDPLRFLCVATLGHRKGTDLLLKGLSQLVGECHFKLLVTGNPEDRYLRPFKRSLSSELWPRIEFKGGLSPAEVAQEMSKATLLVLPTRADTSPNAAKEAVVAGLPVVASNIGGIPDYVFPGQNGVLFNSGDLSDCVAALRNACRHPLFRRGCVEPASLKATRHYLSPTRMGERFYEIYRQVLQDSKNQARRGASTNPA